jgi:endonuclease YncB( thermonuclease family)
MDMRLALAAALVVSPTIALADFTGRVVKVADGDSCAGIDANGEQVRRGMAWVFDRYVKPGSSLYALQSEAKRVKRGLWADPRPMAPWEWRRVMKRAEVASPR